MIKPTIGRVVWFYPHTQGAEGGFVSINPVQPCAAIIAFVWSDHLVNLHVIDHNGKGMRGLAFL